MQLSLKIHCGIAISVDPDQTAPKEAVGKCHFVTLTELRFYSPVNPLGSVYLITLSLGRTILLETLVQEIIGQLLEVISILEKCEDLDVVSVNG